MKEKQPDMDGELNSLLAGLGEKPAKGKPTKSKPAKKRKKDAMSDELKDALETSAEQGKLLKRMRRERLLRRIVAVALAVIIVLLLLFWGIAAYQEFTGGFTINLNYKEGQEGFSLYENRGFNDPQSKLTAEPLRNFLTNISYKEGNLTDSIGEKIISLDEVDAVDGSHHGDASVNETAYFAYTFYIKNVSPNAHEYEARVNMSDAAKNADAAIRLIIIEDTLTYDSAGNGRAATVYGKEAEGGGLDVNCGASFADENGEINNRRGTIIYFKKYLEPGQSHKYTLIMYLEGEDPECVDGIKGGMVKMNMAFLML